MNFYLIHNTREDRPMIIGSETRPTCPILDECEASSWIEAKRFLGFPLTAIQELLASQPPLTYNQRLTMAEMCRESNRANRL